jgi:hypothetical protein
MGMWRNTGYAEKRIAFSAVAKQLMLLRVRSAAKARASSFFEPPAAGGPQSMAVRFDLWPRLFPPQAFDSCQRPPAHGLPAEGRKRWPNLENRRLSRGRNPARRCLGNRRRGRAYRQPRRAPRRRSPRPKAHCLLRDGKTAPASARPLTGEGSKHVLTRTASGGRVCAPAGWLTNAAEKGAETAGDF